MHMHGETRQGKTRQGMAAIVRVFVGSELSSNSWSPISEAAVSCKVGTKEEGDGTDYRLERFVLMG
jgi:hypothetical protein